MFQVPAHSDWHHRSLDRGAYPAPLKDLFSTDLTDAAFNEIQTWPGYQPTPLRTLSTLASDLELGGIHYKDESERFGLGSFKSLGGAYAVLRLVKDQLFKAGIDADLSDIREGKYTADVADITIVTATDGNHGRSVAWGARNAGCRCRIYIHQHVSPAREQAMADLGADVIRVDGDYDFSVHECAREADENGWHVVSDTSYPGYDQVPRNVMAGYTTLASEALAQSETPPTHIILQAGVGGMAAAVAARLWQQLGENRPVIIIAEADRAPCLIASVRSGQAETVAIEEETIMAGLSCGETSLIAWEILSRCADAFITLADEGVKPVMRGLAQGAYGPDKIEGGECATTGLLAIGAICKDATLKQAVRLTADSQVWVIGTEGATDPDLYTQILSETD